jgi:hypothetical protein
LVKVWCQRLLPIGDARPAAGGEKLGRRAIESVGINQLTATNTSARHDHHVF